MIVAFPGVMKLKAVRAAIFINAGLGNAIQLIPLLKHLKQTHRHLTGVFQSPYVSEEILADMDLLDMSIAISPNRRSMIQAAVRYFKAFDEVYLMPMAATWQNLLLARAIGRKIVANFIGKREILLTGATYQRNPLVKHIHDATQNLRLWIPEATNQDLSIELLSYSLEAIQKRFSRPLPPEFSSRIPTPFFTVQTSAAHNLVQYKSWPLMYWIELLRKISKEYPGHHFVLLGGPNELSNAQEIMSQNIPRVISVVGETTQDDVMQLILYSQLLMGHDSGLMHLSMALKRPTFTIWGASDPLQAGYEWLDPSHHCVVSAGLSCGPCYSWIHPNNSRTQRAVDCPDFACLKVLHPNLVFERFKAFVAIL